MARAALCSAAFLLGQAALSTVFFSYRLAKLETLWSMLSRDLTADGESQVKPTNGNSGRTSLVRFWSMRLHDIHLDRSDEWRCILSKWQESPHNGSTKKSCR